MPPHLKPPKRLRSKSRLAAARKGGCCICGNPAADAHHLRIAGHSRGLGIKNGDDWTIPLCRQHHDELHIWGDEKLFLDMHGIDGVTLARSLSKGEENEH
jgi:hypothetical protein